MTFPAPTFVTMTMQGALTFASWTTPTRPGSPATFATGWNTTLGELETWNGAAWVAAVGSGIYLPLAGGEITGNLTVDGTTNFKSGTSVTTLTASSTVTLSPANTTVTLSPSGTGTVVINPATASTINNASIGVTTPLAGKFTTLTATGAVALSPASAAVVLSPTGTGVVTINPATAGTIDNVAVGATTALGGKFTTLAASSTVSGTGFSTYLASPPAIGGTAPANGTFLALKGALRNYLSGGQISAPGGATTLTIQVAAAADSTNTIYMESTGAYTKTTASWAVGSGNGMLDTGTTGGAISTWYHLHEIIRPDTGVVDFLMSLSVGAPTLPTNYTKFRRIGSFFLDGSKNILKVTQTGDMFLLGATVAESGITTPITTSAQNQILTGVPTGVKVTALIRITVSNAAAAVRVLLTSLDENDQAAGTGLATITTQVAGQGTDTSVSLLTDTAATIRSRASAASTTLVIGTYGWVDTRGKN